MNPEARVSDRRTEQRIKPAILKQQVLLAMLIAALLTFAGCGGATSSGKMKVTATIEPLADFCRDVGGGNVEVRALIPAGASPHTFEPTPETMKFISEARVVVENGLGLESWAADVLKKAGNEKAVVVVASKEVPVSSLLRSQGLDDGGEGFDPHVWLDPKLATYEVRSIAEGFSRADPANADEYDANADACIEKLEALDREIKVATSGLSKKRFVSTHPSWGYFARRYGLEQVGSVEELPGREPSVAGINRLMTDVKKLGVTALFAEPQLSPKALEVIAEDAGPGVKVVTVDPLGNPDDPETDTYIRLMRHDAAEMGKALK